MSAIPEGITLDYSNSGQQPQNVPSAPPAPQPAATAAAPSPPTTDPETIPGTAIPEGITLDSPAGPVGGAGGTWQKPGFFEQVFQDLGTKVETGAKNIAASAETSAKNIAAPWQSFAADPGLKTFGRSAAQALGPYVAPSNPITVAGEAVKPVIQATHELIQGVRDPSGSVIAAAKAMGLNTDEVARRAARHDKEGAYAQMTADLIPIVATWALSVAGRKAFGLLAGPAEPELAAGTPATTTPAAVAPSEAPVQASMQQGIKETFAKAATDTEVNPIAADAATRDVASDMGAQVKARGSANYQKLDDASGGRWQRFDKAIRNAQNQYDELVGIDDERAEAARENVETMTADRDQMVQQLIDDKKITETDGAQAKEDWATQSALGRVDRAVKANIRPATATMEETVHSPLNLERRLQALFDDPEKVLQRAMGEDNADDLLTHVRNSNDALNAIKAFKSEAVDIPATGQARLDELVGQHTKVQPRLIGGPKEVTDWTGVLNDYLKIPAGERSLAFGNKTAEVARYLANQAKSQAWRQVVPLTPLGKKMGKIGGIGEVLIGGKLLGGTAALGKLATAGVVAGAMPVAAIGTSGLMRGEEGPPEPTAPSPKSVTGPAAQPLRTAAPEIESAIQQSAGKYNVDPQLVREVIRQESQFNPKAVSPKGAQGLMQLMPKTARDLGVKDPFDVSQNVDGGARYLRQMLDRYNGNVTLALAAYNAGTDKVDKAGGVPNIKETKDYVREIMARYGGGQ